jgi:hypothetical protein
MSTNMLVPTWMTVSGVSLATGHSMGADFVSDAVTIEFEDNVGIQFKWTGTPTGTLTIQTSQDPTNLGWFTETFTSPVQPAGSASGYFYKGGVLSSTPAGFVRFTYTFSSGSGTLYAKISAKSI